MKKIYVREIRHIVANYSLTKKATGYRINSKSIVTKIIRDMIKRNWIECKNIDGQFMFVSPSKILITAVRTEDKISATPALQRNLNWNSRTQNSYYESPATVAA